MLVVVLSVTLLPPLMPVVIHAPRLQVYEEIQSYRCTLTQISYAKNVAMTVPVTPGKVQE